MIYGITDTGVVIKTLLEVKAELEEAHRTQFGNHINLQPESVFSQLIGIYAEREEALWELAEALYAAQYAHSAEGLSLDYVLALTGLTRLAAAYSNVAGQILFGTATTLIPAGTGLSVLGDPTAMFVTLEDVTLIAGTDEVQTITFDAVPTQGSFTLDYNDETIAVVAWDEGAAELQAALNALTWLSGVTVSGSYAAGFVVTFAGDDGKQEQAALVENANSLQDGVTPVVIAVTETTPGVNQGAVDCIAVTTGPQAVAAKALSVIDTPVAGLTRTVNPTAANVGRDLEPDAEARIRRANSLQISTGGTVDGIRAAILALNDVEGAATIESAMVFENNTDAVDVRTMPAHSIGAWVYQENAGITRDQEIAEAIFEAKPGGIEVFGAVSKTVTDSQGFDHTLKFSRPTSVDVYLDLALTVNGDYPVDGDAQVEAAVIAWGNALETGQDIIVYPALVAVLNSIPGITDMVIKIGKTPAPSTDNNVDIDDGTGGDVEFSNWLGANITVTS